MIYPNITLSAPLLPEIPRPAIDPDDTGLQEKYNTKVPPVDIDNIQGKVDKRAGATMCRQRIRLKSLAISSINIRCGKSRRDQAMQ